MAGASKINRIRWIKSSRGDWTAAGNVSPEPARPSRQSILMPMDLLNCRTTRGGPFKPLPHLVGDLLFESGRLRRTDLELPALYRFFTNNFPGNCRISLFISNPSNATDTAEGANPLRRITSSMALSSSDSVS
jgi:hypothetical protein